MHACSTHGHVHAVEPAEKKKKGGRGRRKGRSKAPLAFACDSCQSRFPTRKGLVGHMLRNHQSVDKGKRKGRPKPFACDICQSRFPTRKGLVGHMLRVHSIDLEHRGPSVTDNFSSGSQLPKKYQSGVQKFKFTLSSSESDTSKECSDSFRLELESDSDCDEQSDEESLQWDSNSCANGWSSLEKEATIDNSDLDTCSVGRWQQIVSEHSYVQKFDLENTPNVSVESMVSEEAAPNGSDPPYLLSKQPWGTYWDPVNCRGYWFYHK